MADVWGICKCVWFLGICLLCKYISLHGVDQEVKCVEQKEVNCGCGCGRGLHLQACFVSEAKTSERVLRCIVCVYNLRGWIACQGK